MADTRTEKDEIIDIVKDAIAEIDKAKGGEQTPAKTYQLNVDGQKYEFKSQEELDNTVTTLAKTFREQLDIAKQPSVKQVGSEVTGKEGENSFNDDEYISLMQKDIPKAQRYAMDHIFGMPNAVEAIKMSLNKSADLEKTVAVYQFRERHPEFNVTDKKSTDIIEGIRGELGQPFTLQGLEAAYGVAQSRGLVVSPQLLAYKAQQEKENTGGDPASNFTSGFPVNRGNTERNPLPPPSVSRTNAPSSTNFEAQLDNMSTAELEVVLKKAGLI